MGIRDFFSKLFPTKSFNPSLIAESRGLLTLDTGKMSAQAAINSFDGWVYTCASKNATSVASVPFKMYVSKKSASQKIVFQTKRVSREKKLELSRKKYASHIISKGVEVEELSDHPFINLMASVNPEMNGFELMELTSIYLDLTGNAYWFLNMDNLNTPNEIWLIPSPNVEMKRNKETGVIEGYEYRAGAKRVMFKPEEIINFRMPSPMSIFHGYSPLQAVSTAYNVIKLIDKYDYAIFKNMGRPEINLSSDQALTQDDIDLLKANIAKSQTGVENAGKWLITGKGLRAEKMSYAPDDLGNLEGRKVRAEEIVAAFGLDMSILKPGANRAEAETAESFYYKSAVIPRLTRFEERINDVVRRLYGEQFFIAFDNPIPPDRDFILREREVNIRMGYKTRNEIRAEDGLEPLPPESGDVVPSFGYQNPNIQDNLTLDGQAKSLAEHLVNDIYGN